MKTIFKVFAAAISLILLFPQCEKEPDPIDPNEPVNIPDQAFLDALIEEGVDINGDNIISYGEAEAINNLRVGGNISDMTGIEAFINLDTLFCDHNPISFLDVSKLSNLKVLNCFSCELQSLNVSGNSKLIELNAGNCCGNNNLTELDLSKCKNLEILSVCRNSLPSLDISNNTALKHLWCRENVLTKLDASNNSYLIELYCYENLLTNLDISNNTALTTLFCSNNLLTSLDVSSNIALTTLFCSGNQFTDLDISNNSNLSFLGLNDMTSLYEVCVWTIPFPPENLSLDITGSPNVYFTTECIK